jgi:hypothetical protein
MSTPFETPSLTLMEAAFLDAINSVGGANQQCITEIGAQAVWFLLQHAEADPIDERSATEVIDDLLARGCLKIIVDPHDSEVLMSQPKLDSVVSAMLRDEPIRFRAWGIGPLTEWFGSDYGLKLLVEAYCNETGAQNPFDPPRPGIMATITPVRQEHLDEARERLKKAGWLR